MTGAGFARTGPGVQADIIRDPLDSTLRLSSPEPERSAAQSADCAPSFSGRTITQASQAASSDLMENFRLLAAGGIAGAVSKTVTAPLARLTILYQVNGLESVAGVQGRIGMLQAFQQVIRREGMKALWRGNGVTIVHRLPYSAVNFWAYEQATQLWLQRYPPPPGVQPGQNARADMLRRLTAGGAAGLTACTLAYPLDLVRTRLSAQTKSQYYTGIAHALRTIVRDEGLMGMYRGLGATLLQVTPSLAINYTAYGTLRACWLDLYGVESNTVTMSLACGGAAGLISSTATFPLDLIRRRMQLEGQGGLRRYRGYFDVARTVFRNGGLRGFYAGIIPEYYKVIPGVSCAYMTYELMRNLLGVKTNPGSVR